LGSTARVASGQGPESIRCVAAVCCSATSGAHGVRSPRWYPSSTTCLPAWPQMPVRIGGSLLELAARRSRRSFQRVMPLPNSAAAGLSSSAPISRWRLAFGDSRLRSRIGAPAQLACPSGRWCRQRTITFTRFRQKGAPPTASRGRCSRAGSGPAGTPLPPGVTMTTAQPLRHRDLRRRMPVGAPVFIDVGPPAAASSSSGFCHRWGQGWAQPLADSQAIPAAADHHPSSCMEQRLGSC